ncbi:MAG: (2Fe-2S)-binding protein [Immundisolibacteraceae bacterium]|nr:(2Fe-2S)-binding protein [Immundisolibacteraceae bacterium]
MYVCLCRGITEKKIKKQIALGVDTLSKLQKELGAGEDCGTCCDYLQQMLTDAGVKVAADEAIE